MAVLDLFSLAGRTVIVTGAGSGLGRAMADDDATAMHVRFRHANGEYVRLRLVVTPTSGAQGTRLGIVLMATLLGMALGGWLSGLIFDLTGSYRAAFFNGLAWNLVNVSIMAWLLQRSRRRGQLAAA